MNKICTSIDQSKKLTELGIDVNTADMYYDVNNYGIQSKPEVAVGKVWSKDIPAWSLAALLNIIPVTCDDGRHCLSLINSNPNGDVDWLCCYEDCNGNLLMECYGINQVDACYEMIIKLHEQKLL